MYDLIVIGAGAAGLMAAGTAAMSGRKVLNPGKGIYIQNGKKVFMNK